MQPELVLEPPDAEPGRVGRDDEGADLGVAVGRVVPVRAVTMYVPAWPAFVMNRLRAVEDPGAAVGAVLVPGGGAGAAGVGAGARLGQAVARR